MGRENTNSGSKYQHGGADWIKRDEMRQVWRQLDGINSPDGSIRVTRNAGGIALQGSDDVKKMPVSVSYDSDNQVFNVRIQMYVQVVDVPSYGSITFPVDKTYQFDLPSNLAAIRVGTRKNFTYTQSIKNESFCWAKYGSSDPSPSGDATTLADEAPYSAIQTLFYLYFYSSETWVMIQNPASGAADHYVRTPSFVVPAQDHQGTKVQILHNYNPRRVSINYYGGTGLKYLTSGATNSIYAVQQSNGTTKIINTADGDDPADYIDSEMLVTVVLDGSNNITSVSLGSNIENRYPFGGFTGQQQVVTSVNFAEQTYETKALQFVRGKCTNIV